MTAAGDPRRSRRSPAANEQRQPSGSVRLRFGASPPNGNGNGSHNGNGRDNGNGHNGNGHNGNRRGSTAVEPVAPRPAEAPITWAPFERLTGVLFVLFIAVLTLEWITLGKAAGGEVKFFHLAGIAFSFAFFLRYRPSKTVMPFLSRMWAFYLPWFLFLVVVGVAGTLHHPPYFARSELFRQILYGSIGIVVATFVIAADGRKVRRILSYAAHATCAVLVAGLVIGLAKLHQNPLSILLEALRKHDPGIITGKLLRGAFRSEDLANAGANLRHKVFAAVLISMWLTLGYRDPSDRDHHRVRWMVSNAAVGLAGSLVVISLSRSITLCLGITLGLIGLKTVMRGRAQPRRFAALALGIAFALFLVASPVGSLLQQRFFDQTSSYTARQGAVNDFVHDAGKTALTGGSSTEITYVPHNIILDAWLSGGVLCALAAALFLLAFASLWLREVGRFLVSGGGWLVRFDLLAAIGLGIIPLIRSFSAGNGFHMTEWTAVGIFLGLVYANRAAVARAAATTAGDAAEGDEVAPVDAPPEPLATEDDEDDEGPARRSVRRGRPPLRTFPRARADREHSLR